MLSRLRLRFLGSIAVLAAGCTAFAASLEEGFLSPPPSAGPWVYWTWINGSVTKEGIRADLEDMKRTGIHGAMLFDGSLYLPRGPVRYGSDSWHEHVQYSLRVADELGLEIVLMNCAGWATSGGPWNAVEHSMKKLVWSEQPVAGGALWQGRLPAPASRLNYYRDIAVLAVPDDSSDATTPALTATPARPDLTALGDRNPSTALDFPAGSSAQSLTFAYSQPTRRSLLTIEAVGREITESIEGVRSPADCLPGGELSVSDDGRTFRSVARFREQAIEGPLPVEITFEPSTARYFRVTFERGSTHARAAFRLAELRLSEARRIASLTEKTGLKSEAGALTFPDWVDEKEGSREVIDLTTRLGSDGRLTWDAPPGRWTVLRFGYTTTGTTNHPSAPEGEGLEVDKLDASAVAAHLEHALGRIIREAGPHAGRSLAGILCDSWEAGPQNWTATLPASFQARRGYSIFPHLPALAGHVVGSRAETEAFLADFRRTLGELYAENYHATFQRIAHAHGMKFFAEAYGGVFDESRALEFVDRPMVEFWNHGLYKGFDHAPSMAHLLGRPVVMAEAFTSRPPHAQWTEHPFALKALGDAAFTAGVNSLVLHSYVHQPRSDLAPGFTHGRYGTHFGRLNSWWPLAPSWIDYLKRCQFLLQQGQPVSDLLVLEPERLQSEHRELSPPVVPGHRSDLLPVSQLKRLTVAHRHLQSAGGARYRVLATPAAWVASLDTLQQLARLLDAGATIVGPAPLAPAGKTDLRENREEWQRLVENLWRAPAGRRIEAGDTAAEALARLGVSPDFRILTSDMPADLRFFHRTGNGFDLYFVSNQTGASPGAEADYRYSDLTPAGRPVSVEVEFRVGDRRPELWDAASGRIVRPAAFQVEKGRTRFQLTLAPAESVFVVFRQPLPPVWPVEISLAGAAVPAAGLPWLSEDGTLPATARDGWAIRYSDGSRRTVDLPSVPQPLEITGPWKTSFSGLRHNAPALVLSRLASLSQNTDPAVRYFSGLATYTTTFGWSGPGPDGRTFLDLGAVHDLATITLNGRPVATLWKPPFVADVTGFLRPGTNELAITVANRWINRLIGDETLSADADYIPTGNSAGALADFPTWWRDPAAIARRQRHTFVTWKTLTADSPLLPSGLLGPVTLTSPAAPVPQP